MKYSTFKKEMERRGLIVAFADDGYLYVTTDHSTVGKISLREASNLSTDFRSFNDFGGSFKRMLLQTFTELANTPPKDRGAEKQYRLKLPFVTGSTKYLTMCKTTGGLIVSDPVPHYDDYQYTFTESELTKLKQTNNLDSFVVEEVSEDGE